jgi:cobalt-zinc-cadmium efflux system protein
VEKTQCDDHGGLIHVHGATHGPRLVLSLAVTIGFVLAESLAGFASHSLALLSDAGHNIADAVALALVAWAIHVSKRPANERKTYGYHRANILAALFNAVSLVAIGVVILAQAVSRIENPQAIQGNLMIWTAGASVLLNTVVAWLLMEGAKTSLNMRAGFIHMAGDAASAAGVVIAGIVIKTTGWVYADTLVSALIGAFILSTAWSIVRESTNILLEAAPKGLDFEQMIAEMHTVPGVLSVHDVHAWTVSDGMNCLSCHVELDAQATMQDSAFVVADLNRLLADRFAIHHATLQTEMAGACDHSPHCHPRISTTPARQRTFRLTGFFEQLLGAKILIVALEAIAVARLHSMSLFADALLNVLSLGIILSVIPLVKTITEPPSWAAHRNSPRSQILLGAILLIASLGAVKMEAQHVYRPHSLGTGWIATVAAIGMILNLAVSIRSRIALKEPDSAIGWLLGIDAVRAACILGLVASFGRDGQPMFDLVLAAPLILISLLVALGSVFFGITRLRPSH